MVFHGECVRGFFGFKFVRVWFFFRRWERIPANLANAFPKIVRCLMVPPVHARDPVAEIHAPAGGTQN